MGLLMKYFKPIIVSVIIHLCIGAMLTLKLSGDGLEQGNDIKSVKINIISPKEDKENKNQDRELTNGKILVKQIDKSVAKPIDEECSDHYYGIGVVTLYNPCRILEVYSGYPAHKNGIMVNDIIVAPACQGIVGESESIIKMVILRGDNLINLTFKRGKICGKK